MNNQFLNYFEKELESLKKDAVEFSKSNPKLARNLGLNEKGIDDPNISRLIESIAFLNAKVSKRLDDGVEEMAESMLATLYPDFEAPFPAISAAKFEIDGSLATESVIKQGELITLTNENKQEWFFSVAADTEINPIQVSKVEYKGLPFEKPEAQGAEKIKAKLSISFEVDKKVAKDEEIQVNSLRLKFNDEARVNTRLYEAIAKGTVCAELEIGAEKKKIELKQIKKTGFESELKLLPKSYQQLDAMQLARSVLNSVESYLYLELQDLQIKLTREDQLTISLYLSKHDVELEQNVSAKSIEYGCVPIVNLYSQSADPYLLKDNETRDIEISDNRRRSLEVQKIEQVESLVGKATRRIIPAAYEPTLESEDDLCWSAKRHKTILNGAAYSKISLQIQHKRKDVDGVIIQPRVWVMNQHGASQEINRSERLTIEFNQARSEIKSITLGESVREGKRIDVSGRARWAILKRLNMGYISEQGVTAIKELLHQVNVYQDEQINLMIEAITDCSTKRITKRAFDEEHSGFLNGHLIKLQIAKAPFENCSMYIFGLVINRLLSELTAINSFTQLVIETVGQSTETIIFPVRSGQLRFL